MPAFLRRFFSSKFFPVAWTIFTIALLCLPGSMVPGTGLFGLKNLDKVVHVILFGLNVLFWGWHFAAIERPERRLRYIFLGAVALVILLGVLMEYVQLYFIPNRSFDVGDIMADAIGAVLAGIWLLRN